MANEKRFYLNKTTPVEDKNKEAEYENPYSLNKTTPVVGETPTVKTPAAAAPVVETPETPITETPASVTETVQTPPPAVEAPQEHSAIMVSEAKQTKQENPVHVYLGDYGKDTDLEAIAARNNKSLQEVFTDYQKWGRETGNPTDFLPIWRASQKKDITKTPKQIEEEEKKQKNKERLERIGNFLSHLGNFIGTAGFGAPSQTLESPRELTARQQALRDKTEALRTAYNKNYMENYWKQRADERANQNQDRLERRYDLAVRQQEWKELSDQKKFDYNMEKLKIEQDYKDGLISIRQKELAIKQLDAYTRRMNAGTSKAREARLAGGTETETTVTKETLTGPVTTTTKKVTKPSSSKGATPKSGNDWSKYKTNK